MSGRTAPQGPMGLQTLIRRGAPPVLAALACVLLWFGWQEIGLLRGTWFWELRYVVAGVAAIAVLTAARWVEARVSRSE